MKTSFEFRRKNEVKWSPWLPAHAVWLLEQINTPVGKGGLGPNPMPPKSFMPGKFRPGSMETPWTMETIDEWCGAASQVVEGGYDTGLYEVGGVMLERNPSSGDFSNYITAVKDSIASPLAVSRKVSPRGNLLIFDDDADRSNKMIYEIKCERMNTEGRDAEVAKIGREVMQRTRKSVPGDLIELPNTLGAMFISEAARLPLMLPLGLMMLDLMEAEVHYGKAGVKPYTWKKLMSYTKDDGEGRLTKAKLAGGKHPMMHENTINQAKTFSETFNVVTLRSVSILVKWLDTYVARAASGWEMRVVSEAMEVATAQRGAITKTQKVQFEEKLRSQSPHATFYGAVVKPALLKRSQTLDLVF
jgi:hypothetical protein